MTVVNSQQELVAAISTGETDIRVGADFTLSAQVSVNRSFTLTSNADEPFIVTKADGFYGTLFRVFGGTLTLQNIILDGAKDSHERENVSGRSLVLVSGGTLQLQNAVLRNNNSYLEGGAVYLSGNAAYANGLVVGDGSVISGCYSRTNGGGIMAALRSREDSVLFSGSVLIENNQAAYGAGLYMRSYVEDAASRLTLSNGVVFSGNEATSYGGGINFSGFRGANAAVSQLIVNGAQFNANAAKHGGGIYFYGAAAGDTLQCEGMELSSNRAEDGYGGGVYLNATEPAILTLQNCAFDQNTATNGGGFAVLSAGCAVTVTDTVVSGNASTAAGGGCWLQNTSAAAGLDISFHGGRFTSNAGSAGGAAYLTAGSYAHTLRIDGTTFAQNSATGAGGAIAYSADADSSVSMDTAVFSQNVSGQSGGAIYFANGGGNAQVTLSAVQIVDNTAAFEGGGLRLTSGTGRLETTVSDCVVTGNTARDNSGGGIWLGGDANLMTLAGSTQISRNATVRGNGGGVYLNSAEGSLTVKDSVRITYNSADGRISDFGNHGGGICLVPGALFLRDEAEIAYNAALTFGGGVSAAEQSRIQMTGGSIHDNETKVFGGGLYNKGGSVTNLSDGAVYGNSAGFGGAVYNTDGSTLIVTAEASVGTDTPNTASGYAPGIYNDSVLETEGNRELTNGVYIANRDAVVRLTAALAPSSAIQLDNTPYVAPNSAGTPVVVAVATDGYPLLSQTDADAFIKPPKNFDGWEIRLYASDTQIVLAPVVYPIHYENLFDTVQPNPESYTVATPDIVLYSPTERPGYVFTGWVDGAGTSVTLIPHGSTGERTLYATWERITHILTYDGNGSPDAPAGNVPPPQAFFHGEDVTVSLQLPARQGYAFIGWNATATGGGTAYLPGDTIPAAAAEITLYAVWEKLPAKEFTLSYRANDWCCPPAACIPDAQILEEGTQIWLSSLTPRRDCYAFIGWNEDPCASAAQYLPGQNIGAAARDIVLYAIWEYCPCL